MSTEQRDAQACCAHRRVAHRTEEYRATEADALAASRPYDPSNPNTPLRAGQVLTRDYWECDSGCGTRFEPVLASRSAPSEDGEPRAWLVFFATTGTLYRTVETREELKEYDGNWYYTILPLYAHPSARAAEPAIEIEPLEADRPLTETESRVNALHPAASVPDGGSDTPEPKPRKFMVEKFADQMPLLFNAEQKASFLKIAETLRAHGTLAESLAYVQIWSALHSMHSGKPSILLETTDTPDPGAEPVEPDYSGMLPFTDEQAIRLGKRLAENPVPECDDDLGSDL